MRNPLPGFGGLFTRLRKRITSYAKRTRDIVLTLHLDERQQQLDEAAAMHSLTVQAGRLWAQPTALLCIAPATTLETLPAELRCLVLSHLSDLDDLRALVLASPVFYQQYLLDRKALLGHGLRTALGSLLVDAYAVQTSTSLYGSCDSTHDLQPEAIRLFIDEYVALRTATPDMILKERCTEQDLLGMAAFHQSLVWPLSWECAVRFLNRLDLSLEVGNLSATESIRLLRALYRYQLYCNLFGRGPRGYREAPGLDWEEQLAVFFGVFRPWEIEEIHCIYVLLRDTYDNVFDAVQCDLHRDNPRFKDWDCPATPPGSWDLGNSFIRELVREGIASRGLPLFYRVLKIDDHQPLVGLMQRYLVYTGVFVETILGWTNQSNRRDRYPSEDDQMEARRERLPFFGDTEDGPPLAWVIAWRGKYSNSYGAVISDSLKTWGHVFWDSKRLILSRGTDEVVREREMFSF